mgnify:CR=1 FL=1
MESEKCRVLLCAIDKGSITAAAEAMGYTISGVSRMMAALEAEVGFPLLRRSREGVTPTNECCRLLPSFREMVAQAEQCRQIAGEVRGHRHIFQRGHPLAAQYDRRFPEGLSQH